MALVVAGTAVGLIHHWSWRRFMTFPPPHTASEGDDCYVVFIGRCSSLECGLLYLDAFGATAATTWYLCRRCGGGGASR